MQIFCVMYKNIFMAWKCTERLLPGSACRSKRIAAQCFCTGSKSPALPVCPAAAVPPPAGKTEACRTPEEECECMAARRTKSWPVHTGGGRPALHCPWPVGSCPGCTEDLGCQRYHWLSFRQTILLLDQLYTVTCPTDETSDMKPFRNCSGKKID